MNTTQTLFLLLGVTLVLVMFVLYPQKERMRCSKSGGLTPATPVTPVGPKALVPLDSIGVASNACGNIFFYGACTEKLESISGSMTINGGAPIKLTILGKGSGSLRPYIYNPAYKYGWDALWNTPVKLNDKVCCTVVVNAGGRSQTVSKCITVDNCKIDGILWGFGKGK